MASILWRQIASSPLGELRQRLVKKNFPSSPENRLTRNQMRAQFHEQNPYLVGRSIVIEGPIGVGKTSLARLLADRWKCQSIFESFEENPFLTEGFYENKRDFAFNTEVFFLLSRFRQFRSTSKTQETSIADYLFHKNAIFSKLNLSEDDWAIYEPLYREFAKQVPNPDLIVYLTADIDTLMKRVYLRDRQFERSMPRDYLDQLRASYEDYFSTYTDSPVLRINARDFDFVNQPQDFSRITSMIEDRLKGVRQLSFQGLNPFQERSAQHSA